MRILILAEKFFGLSETFVHKQVSALAGEHELFLAGFERENKAAFPIDSKLEIPFYQISSVPHGFVDRLCSKFHRLVRKTGQYAYPCSTEKQLTQLIKEKEIDLVFAHYGTNGIKALPLARKLNVSLLVAFHGYDASRKLGDEKYAGKLRDLFKYASFVTICTRDMVKRLKKCGLPDKKVVHVPYGVDLQHFSEVYQNRENKNPVVLHAGRLTPKKGVVDLLKVCIALWKAGMKFELKIIGDGSDYDEVSKLAESSDFTENIQLMGFQAHEKLLKTMETADIFILNSRVAPDGDMEGFPNAVIEAMASACAVLSTRHAGIPDAVDSGVNGILVKERDNEELKMELRTLLESPEKRKEFGMKAKEKAFMEFGEDKMKQKLLNTINKLN